MRRQPFANQTPKALAPALLLLSFGAVALAAPRRVAPRPVAGKPAAAGERLTLEEARLRVAMLDDAYHLLLEEVHDTYPTKPGRPVAATVVRDLQKRMSELGWPHSRFLAVNAVIMNPDHRPKDQFEREVVLAMKDGARHVEKVEPGTLRAATSISLGGKCFSCHWADSGAASTAAISWTVLLKPSK